MSLLVLSNDDPSPVTSIPPEDVINVALVEVDKDPDPIEQFSEPNRLNTLNDTSPKVLHQAQTLLEPPRLPKTLLTREPVKQDLSEKINNDTKIDDPKVTPNLETLTPIKVTELSSEEAIKKLDRPDEPPPKPTHPILPTRDVPLQISEIDLGNTQEVIVSKASVPEPISTLPVQSEPLIPMPQDALDTQPVSQRQRITDPIRPIQNPDLGRLIQPTKPVHPSPPSKGPETVNKVHPALAEDIELALKPLKLAPQIIARSRQNVARSAPVSEHASHDGVQKKEEKEAIAQYVTLLHKAISNRARRDYPSRAIKRREEGRVLADIKVDSDGELLEIKISNESTASDTLIRAAERAIKKEAPFAQFAQVVNKEARWFSLSLNYRIHTGSQ